MEGGVFIDNRKANKIVGIEELGTSLILPRSDNLTYLKKYVLPSLWIPSKKEETP